MARKRRAERGYTLIELSVVIAVLALLAAGVVPMLTSIGRSQTYYSFLNKLGTIGAQAREQAIALAKPVDLEFDSSNNQFKIHTLDDNGGDTSLQTLQLPDGFAADRFQLSGRESDAGEWKLNFYPDGSSDGGGVQVTQGNNTITLYSDSQTGRTTLTHEPLPDPSTLTWTAGDYIHRAT
jgi:prepilin-type N-terminal cleavage/methylation domain-containing protein